MSEGPEKSIKEITKGFSKHGYICSKQIATAVYLASQLEKPILIEGPPGVGKTPVAKAVAADLGWNVIELNASDARNATEIRRAATHASTHGSLFMTRVVLLRVH